MKILFLSFYFEPDLCAGSFRNTPLVTELSKLLPKDSEIIVITTQPNRYKTYSVKAESYEDRGKIKIHRIEVPLHSSGMKDQMRTFTTFYKKALSISRNYKFDLIYASSSRLFTAYLGSKISRRQKSPLYIDVRDIFVDTMDNILKNKIARLFVLNLLKIIESRTFRQASHVNLISEGFKDYFVAKYRHVNYTYYPNGIDSVFINAQKNAVAKDIKTIIYAGNIGTGQGLEKIIPQAAKKLGNDYQFHIYGDGGKKEQLLKKIEKLGVSNVIMHKPINRVKLIEVYKDADFLFLHLNKLKAFEKVLPSKLFEYGAFHVPIIAGVDGYAKKFIKDYVKNAIVFEPCNVVQFTEQIKEYEYQHVERLDFIRKFKRDSINLEMAKSILNSLNK